ncbi:MAG: PQQ-binding-like beta-propeller repeat protein [Bacteroidota bacterium]
MTNQLTLLRSLVFLGLIMLNPAVALPQALAQWRGADHRGIYPEPSALTAWPDGGPKLLWSTDQAGDGYGSPVILDGKLYICGAYDSTAILFVFTSDGRPLLKMPYGKEWTTNYVGCRNAPTITREAIYLSTGLGDLVCLDRETFSEKWRVDGRRGFHNTLPLFGHAESPAVDGNLVFFVPGGKDTNVVALDRFTGKIVWVCKGAGERPGYNSPLIIHLPSRTVLVTFTAYELMGIDARDGRLLWSHPQVNIPVAEHVPGNGDTHSNTVWYEDGTIFYIAGDGNGAVRLTLSASGDSIKQVWRNPAIDNYMGGFVKQGNLIYTCTDSKKSMYSLDASTGRVTDTLKCGTGALISDGKMFYYYNQKGEMNLVGTGAAGLELKGKFPITQGTKEHFSHPVIDHGVLYLRHGKALMAWGIKK